MSKVFDYIVIGGGISGLSAAWKLKENGLSGLVLEKSAKAGGCVESSCIAGFCQELGAHSVFNSYQGIIEIIKSLELTREIIEKKSLPFLLWDKNQVTSVIKSLNLISMAFSLPKILWLNKKGKKVNEYYADLGGRDNYENLIRHALNAVACQDMSKAPADFLFQKRKRDKSLVKKFSFKQGLGQFINSLADSLNIENTAWVSSIKLAGNNYFVTTKERQYIAKKLVLAVPAKSASGLLKGIDDSISSKLDEFRQSTFYSVALAVDKTKVRVDKCAGWIGKNADFYSMVSADPVNENSTLRGFTFHFKEDLGSIEELQSKALKLLNLKERDVEYIKTKENLLPAIGNQHYSMVAKIDELLNSKSFGITGNYFNGMSLEDCVQRSFGEAARLISLKS